MELLEFATFYCGFFMMVNAVGMFKIAFDSDEYPSKTLVVSTSLIAIAHALFGAWAFLGTIFQ